jgi:predicted DNA-binding transcriptional regulator YafY
MHRDDIVRALEERQVLLLTYGTGGPRTVQPHAIVRKPDGTEILEAYQVRGYTETDAEHGWKSFEIGRIESLELLQERFEPRRDFRPVSSQSAQVVATVRAPETMQI